MARGQIVGYVRTSTADQHAGYEAQERELRAAQCEKLFGERVSSVASRAQLAAALDYVREGDTLVVTRPDQLARSTADLLRIVAALDAKKVALRVLSMGGQVLDTASPTGKLTLTMLGAVAEFERGSCWNGSARASPRPRRTFLDRATGRFRYSDYKPWDPNWSLPPNTNLLVVDNYTETEDLTVMRTGQLDLWAKSAAKPRACYSCSPGP